jgi:hypothetical protein
MTHKVDIGNEMMQQLLIKKVGHILYVIGGEAPHCA